MTVIPEKLKKGDNVRVIAPSRSLNLPFIIPVVPKAAEGMKRLGLTVSYGKHVKERDEFGSTTIEHRVQDLHDAFSDKKVKLVITIMGGFNVNQLLKYIDYDLIKRNPKVLCGYSDITALANAIYAKTGLVTYSGPHFFTFGVEERSGYTSDYFKRCLFSSAPFSVEPSAHVLEWARDEQKYIDYKNDGNWILQNGEASGTIIGANLCTFNLLQGTEFMPSLEDSILFIEDDDESSPVHFDRDLQSLLHQPSADGIKGVVIGRLQKMSAVSRKTLAKIISTKKELKGLPVLANVDFGHTYPMITFPIGGTASLKVEKKNAELKILKH